MLADERGSKKSARKGQRKDEPKIIGEMVWVYEWSRSSGSVSGTGACPIIRHKKPKDLSVPREALDKTYGGDEETG